MKNISLSGTIIFVLIVVFFSCKKDAKIQITPPVVVPPEVIVPVNIAVDVNTIISTFNNSLGIGINTAAIKDQAIRP